MGVVAIAGGVANAGTYYIGQSTDYTGNGCESPDVPEDTSYLSSQLKSFGWSGQRYVDSQAWPQDLQEQCSAGYGAGGLDGVYADTKDLVVFSGHGGLGGNLYWGTAHNGVCDQYMGANMRLGSMTGSSASYAIYNACCVLNTNTLVDHANWQWLRQQFGFHGLAAISAAMTGDFLDATGPYPGPYGTSGDLSNKQAWLGFMEDKPGWFTGDNSAVVVSYGATQTEANNVRSGAKLGRGTYVSRRPSGPTCGGTQPLFYYIVDLVDHGDSGC